jgi:hypothetical protein
MADQWHYSHDQQEFGPFSATRMKDLAATGEVLVTDAVWKDGSETRVLAAKVKGLFQQRPPRTHVQLIPVETPIEPVARAVPVSARSAQAGALAPLDSLRSARGDGASPTSVVGSTGSGNAKSQSHAVSAHDQRRAQPEPIQKLRVVAIRGAVIVSQDGRVACYKKKCINCGHEDPNRTTMQIRRGINRVSFFCPECRKTRTAEIQGLR